VSGTSYAVGGLVGLELRHRHQQLRHGQRDGNQ